MSMFSLSAIEALDYDFTGIPSNSRHGEKCTGKGTIPEPSQERIEAYATATRELYEVEENDEVEDAIERAAQEKEKSKTLLKLTAELCQNSPSAEEIEDLPPRYQKGFLTWIFRELANPEVSSAGTRR
ncbi:MAG: hypothetical protein CYG60_07075 [Actinobacteria bacterium]|nr:MAG: hypothetical protein CYG60_07075 [Actinomycetota bacterium]